MNEIFSPAVLASQVLHVKQHETQFKVIEGNKVWKLPLVVGDNFMDFPVLPLGYHTEIPPSSAKACDLVSVPCWYFEFYNGMS